jgi:cell division protein FtsL
VIVLLVVGVVALNALLAQTAFAVHAMEASVSALQDRRDVLATEVARLSSPGQIATWASRYHMVLPTDVVILHVPDSHQAAGAP